MVFEPTKTALENSASWQGHPKKSDGSDSGHKTPSLGYSYHIWVMLGQDSHVPNLKSGRSSECWSGKLNFTTWFELSAAGKSKAGEAYQSISEYNHHPSNPYYVPFYHIMHPKPENSVILVYFPCDPPNTP